MQAPDEILAGLTAIANRWFVFAMGWHLLTAAALIAASQRWRPPPRMAGLVLLAPLLSVSACSWAIGDRFDGTVCLALAAGLALISFQASEAQARRPTWATALGAALVSFGWIYPHFLQGWPQVTYLIAAPLGLVPAPTMALVMGFSLLGFGPSGRAWALTLASAGLFFAVFGALHLGVLLDLVLLAGTSGLVLRSLGRQPRAAPLLYLVKSELDSVPPWPSRRGEGLEKLHGHSGSSGNVGRTSK